MSLTAERLRDVLGYEPDTGVFRWATPRRHVRVGDVAGGVGQRGYRLIGVDGSRYYAHRLAWLHIYGEWPVGEIDHRNGVRDDNRIVNLREATTSENMQNVRRARRDNQCGLLGVSSPKGRRWRAQIWLDGKKRYLGHFDSPTDAHVAYLAAKRELHPFFEEVPAS